MVDSEILKAIRERDARCKHDSDRRLLLSALDAAEIARQQAEQAAGAEFRLRVEDASYRLDAEARVTQLEGALREMRAALVGVIGVDGREQLEHMEVMMRSLPMPAEDAAVSIDAIRLLIATLPSDTLPSPDHGTHVEICDRHNTKVTEGDSPQKGTT